MKEAMLYEKLEGNKVRCNLCNHRCVIPDGGRGVCRVRENRGGTLYSLVYSKAIAANVDPIEKKPIFHLAPGSTSMSIATVGCNFRCPFCQNWQISQILDPKGEIRGQDFPPEDVVAAAKHYRCKSISYTYTEPTIFFEYAYDTAVLAHKEGIYNVFVTNGFMTTDALEAIKDYLDAANVDLKSFRDETYRKLGGRLNGVLDSLKKMKELGIWVEVTTLIVPGMNDSEEELRDIARFIAQELGPETPWHVSRFHPDYKMLDRGSTPISKIERAREIGLEEGLRYVYSGNVPGDPGENTYCYNCGTTLIERFGFRIVENRIQNSRCPVCGAKVDGVEMSWR
ncbi:AmmeMemoRadiSam system radical SAM enzyme [Candidatus Poribacteria bacterium]|nr:MAG: AmmeMemoRadiSam system radical SAM enzyme [Candidatus Poribacteria bacterium]